MTETSSRLARFGGIAWRLLIVVFAVVVLYVFATEWTRWEGDARWITTDDAYLQTDITPLSAQVAGYIRAVPVQDYQTVQAGQLVAQIDDAPYRADVAQAEAGVAIARAQIAQVQAQRPLLQANLRAAQATAAATQAAADQNQRDLARANHLLQSGSESTEQIEKLQTGARQFTAQLGQNRAQTDAVSRQLDLLQAQLQSAEATLQARQAALDLARINLGYTRITAPTGGELGLRQVFPGEFIAAGTQIARLGALPDVWVLANYKETQLTHVRIGQPAKIAIDIFPGRTLYGHVVAIAPASGAALALLPPDNATGNFTKIVQRVTVKIVIDDSAGLRDQLRAGLSAVPSIDTHSNAQ